MFAADILRFAQFALCTIQLVLGPCKSMIEGLDILIFGQDFLLQLLDLRLGLLSACNGGVGLLTERINLSLILSMG